MPPTVALNLEPELTVPVTFGFALIYISDWRIQYTVWVTAGALNDKVPLLDIPKVDDPSQFKRVHAEEVVFLIERSPVL